MYNHLELIQRAGVAPGVGVWAAKMTEIANKANSQAVFATLSAVSFIDDAGPANHRR